MSALQIFETIFFVVVFILMIRNLVIAVKKKDRTGIKVELLKIAVAAVIAIAVFSFNP